MTQTASNIASDQPPIIKNKSIIGLALTQTASNTAYDQSQIKNKLIIGLVLTTSDELGLHPLPKYSSLPKIYHNKRPFAMVQTASKMVVHQPPIKNKL